jgi:hypothetical protein
MSDICVVAQILNPHPANRGCGLKLFSQSVYIFKGVQELTSFGSHALISNIMNQNTGLYIQSLINHELF